MKTRPRARHWNAADGGNLGIDRREQQRAVDDRHRRQADNGEGAGEPNRPVRDGQHVAEQDVGRQPRHLGGQRQEEQAQPHRERQRGPDGCVASAQLVAQQAHAQPGCHGEQERAEEQVAPQQDGAGGAGEADVRQGVAGEGEAPQNDEITDDPGADRRHRAGQEGVAHKREFKHLHSPCDGSPHVRGASPRASGRPAPASRTGGTAVPAAPPRPRRRRPGSGCGCRAPGPPPAARG